MTNNPACLAGAEEQAMKTAFKIWLAIMVPTVIILTIVGYQQTSYVILQ